MGTRGMNTRVSKSPSGGTSWDTDVNRFEKFVAISAIPPQLSGQHVAEFLSPLIETLTWKGQGLSTEHWAGMLNSRVASSIEVQRMVAMVIVRRLLFTYTNDDKPCVWFTGKPYEAALRYMLQGERGQKYLDPIWGVEGFDRLLKTKEGVEEIMENNRFDLYDPLETNGTDRSMGWHRLRCDIQEEEYNPFENGESLEGHYVWIGTADSHGSDMEEPPSDLKTAFLVLVRPDEGGIAEFYFCMPKSKWLRPPRHKIAEFDMLDRHEKHKRNRNDEDGVPESENAPNATPEKDTAKRHRVDVNALTGSMDEFSIGPNEEAGVTALTHRFNTLAVQN